MHLTGWVALQGPAIMPIDVTAVVAVIMGLLVVLIPIAGLTLRFAIKPVAEALARMRDSTTTNETVQLLERRITLLEQEGAGVMELRQEVKQLREAVEFELQLEAGKQREAP
ncbi:MAG: hypothetical protein WEB88_16935 [Gemmatimonadota bacterium]